MPDEGAINKDFLKEVFAGKKQLLRKQEVSYITVPQYDEISVKALWPELKKDANPNYKGRKKKNKKKKKAPLIPPPNFFATGQDR